MMRRTPSVSLQFRPAFAAGGLAAVLLAIPASAQEKITYQDHVRPVFENRCLNCHNADRKRGDLDLSTFAGVMAGGSGGQIVEPGDSGSSRLWQVITHAAEPIMPPKGDKLPDAETGLIAKWIEGGLLETGASRARKKRSAGIAMEAGAAAAARPEGPPPMPEHLLLEPSVTAPRADAITSIAHSPWAPLAAVAAPREVLLFHTGTGELAGVLPFPGGGSPDCVRFSRNGLLVLAGGGIPGKRGVVAVWEVKTGRRVITLEPADETDSILGADISADLTRIATGGPGRKVRLYDAATLECIATIGKHTDWVTAVAFSPDGVLLATGDRGGGLYVWEAGTGNEFYTLKGHDQRISALAWRGDSNVLAAGSEDGSFTLWEMAGGSQVKKTGSHGGVLALGFAPDGRLVSAGRDGHARIWDASGNQQRDWVPAGGDLVLSAAFTDDGSRVLTGSWNGELRCWDATKDAEPLAIDANPPSIGTRIAALESLIAMTESGKESLGERERQAREALAAATAALEEQRKAAADSAARLKEAEMILAAAGESLTGIETSRAGLLERAAETAAKLKAAAQPSAQTAPEENKTEKAPSVPESVQVLLRKADESGQLVDRLRVSVLREQQKTIASILVKADAALNAAGMRLESAREAAEQARAAADAAAASVSEREQAVEAATRAWEEAKAAAGAAEQELAGHFRRLRFWEAARQNTEALRLAAEAAAAGEEAAAAAEELASIEAAIAASEEAPGTAAPPDLGAQRDQAAAKAESLTARAAELSRQAEEAREKYLSMLPQE